MRKANLALIAAAAVAAFLFAAWDPGDGRGPPAPDDQPSPAGAAP